MRRLLPQRVTSGLLAGIFLLAGTADVYGLHGCPHHDQHGAQHEAAAQAVEAPEKATEHGHAAHLASGSPTPEHPTDGPCTCVGICHGTATTPVLAAGPEQAVPEPGGDARAVPAPAQRAPSTDPTSFLTPFPNGPPPIG